MLQKKEVSSRRIRGGESSLRERGYKQNGQAYVEYIVAAVLIIGALWAPVFNGESAISILYASLKANQESYVWAMSVPD
ncbi:MAG: hypothetical protein V7688_14670 [Alcanivorax jadensis]|jgi:hypothetical protein|uniref:hypothetical protein n=1 Tax=Alcanivorax jadensis TaxID=64988 RepID=UPI0030011F90